MSSLRRHGSAAEQREENALQYVIRHSKPSASMNMTSALDRPEGYGILPASYRLSMAHRRPLQASTAASATAADSSKTPKSEGKEKTKADQSVLSTSDIFAQHFPYTESFALARERDGENNGSPASQLRNAALLSSPIRDNEPSPSLRLFSGSLEEVDFDVSRDLDNGSLNRSLLAIRARAKSAIAHSQAVASTTYDGGSQRIVPGSGPTGTAGGQLTATNILMYRREPRDPSTGESLLAEVRFRRTEMWLGQMAALASQHAISEGECDTAELVTPTRVERKKRGKKDQSPTKGTLNLVKKDRSPDSPHSPLLSSIISEIGMSPNWAKLRHVTTTVCELKKREAAAEDQGSQRKLTVKDIRNPFLSVETTVSQDIAWFSRQLSTDGTSTTRLVSPPIKSSALLSESTVEPSLVQHKSLHCDISSRCDVDSDGPQQQPAEGIPVSRSMMPRGDSRTGNLFVSNSMKRRWNAEFQTLLDEMYGAANAKLVVTAYTKIKSLCHDFIKYCSAFVQSELQKTLLIMGQVTDNNVIFSVLSRHLDGADKTDNRRGGSDASSDESREDIDGADDTGIDLNGTNNMIQSWESAGAKQQEQYHAPRESMVDPLPHQRKFASNDLTALRFLYKSWWKVADPSFLPLSESPFVSKCLTPDVPLPKRPSRRDTCAFPLTCTVHFLGHTVVCTAALTGIAPGDIVSIGELQRIVAASATTTPPLAGLGAAAAAVGNSRNSSSIQTRFAATCQETLCSIGRHLRIAPYVRHTNTGSDGSTVRDIVFTSANVIVGYARDDDVKMDNNVSSASFTPPSRGRAYLLSLATLQPPVLPQPGLAPTLRLRPEFTSSVSDSIVSDAFDASISSAEMPKKCVAQVLAVKTMRRLMHKSFSNILNGLDSAMSIKITGAELCHSFHRSGINIAFLGRFGDLVVDRLRCTRSAVGLASATVENMTHLATTVREELAVRAFRACWVEDMRALLASSTVVGEREQNAVTEGLMRSFLGPESDAEVTSFWQNQLTPTIRRKFGFRSPISRSDVSLRAVLKRLQLFCGIVMGESHTCDDGRSNGILGAAVLEARSAKLGAVKSIVPYVKSCGLPAMPPLWHHPDIFVQHIDKALESLVSEAISEEGEDSEVVLCLSMRLAEVYFAQGEHRFKACEGLLTSMIRRHQMRPAPLYRELVEMCVNLAALYNVEHRYAESIKIANDAAQIELEYQTTPQHPLLEKIFVIATKSCRESSKGAAAAATLERCAALLLRRMNALELSPLSLESWSSSSNDDAMGYANPADFVLASKTVDNFRAVLPVVVTKLAAAYEEAASDQQPPPASSDMTCNISFLKFLCELGIHEFKHFRPVPAVGTFARCVQIADELRKMAAEGKSIGAALKSGTVTDFTTMDAILTICNQNLVVARLLTDKVSREKVEKRKDDLKPEP